MRFHYVPLLAAAALAASAHGRQAVVGAPEAEHQAVSPTLEKGAMERHLRSHDDSDNRYNNPYHYNNNGDSSDYSSDTGNNYNVMRNPFYNGGEDRSMFSKFKDTKKGDGEAESESESSSVSSSDISPMLPPTGAPLAVPAKRRDGLDDPVKRLTKSVADKKAEDN